VPASAIVGSFDYLRRWRLPSQSSNAFLWMTQMAAIRAGGHTAVLDGEGGDEVFAMQPMAMVDELLRGRVRQAQALAGHTYAIGRDGRSRWRRLQVLGHFARAGVVPHAMLHTGRQLTGAGFPASPLLSKQARRHVRELFDPWEWKQMRGPLWTRQLVDSTTDTRDRLEANSYLRRRAAMHGLDSRHPFLHDVDLVETVASIPPEFVFDGYRDRPLLRDAMAGTVPEPLRTRQGKSYFNSVISDSVITYDLPVLRDLFTGAAPKAAAWIDVDRLRRELDRPAPDRHPRGRVVWSTEMYRVGALECWLRSLAGDDLPRSGGDAGAGPGATT
jgi:asparagine synthetase B (glutamine-hydrolysing)